MDRNAIARKAFNAGVGMRKNGSGVLVPERLAGAKDEPSRAVGVAITSGDQVPANFAMALGAMEYMLGRIGLPFYLFGMKGEVPAVNRNNAVEQAKSFKCGWLLLIDATVTFPPNALPRILQAAIEQKLDIVGVTVANRAVPHQNMALATGAEKVKTVGAMVEVGTIPGAFLLISMAVFEKLKRPYFRYPVVEEAEGVEPRLLDDMAAFCEAARAAGSSVMLDVELSQQVVNWGECGYRLTGSEDQSEQFERVELGMKPTTAANEAEVAGEGAGDTETATVTAGQESRAEVVS